MRRRGWVAVVGAGLAAACVLLVVALLLVKLLWSWTIPDLLPGAVQQGLVAGSISWLTAFKVAVFIGVLGGFAGPRRTRHVSGDNRFEVGIG